MLEKELEAWCDKIPRWQLEKALKLLERQRVRCFGYINTAYGNDGGKEITRDIRSLQMAVLKEWADCYNRYLDPKMVFFPENVDRLIKLMESDDYVKEMDYKYLVVYEFDDFYYWWGEAEKKKQKKLASLCDLRDIEVISAREELRHD